MLRVWRYSVAVIFLLDLLMGGSSCFGHADGCNLGASAYWFGWGACGFIRDFQT